MLFNVRQLETDVLGAPHQAGGTLTVNFDIGDWPDEMVRETVDQILANSDQYKARLKGIRTDTAGFAKFGIDMDSPNSGRYQGIPVVMTYVPFDTMELVFPPRRT
jgi:hypothetical protein